MWLKIRFLTLFVLLTFSHLGWATHYYKFIQSNGEPTNILPVIVPYDIFEKRDLKCPDSLQLYSKGDHEYITMFANYISTTTSYEFAFTPEQIETFQRFNFKLYFIQNNKLQWINGRIEFKRANDLVGLEKPQI